jgi:hypothetical protein
MEHTATCASKNRVSRFAVLLADFCNKIGTSATSQRDLATSAYEVKAIVRRTSSEGRF